MNKNKLRFIQVFLFAWLVVLGLWLMLYPNEKSNKGATEEDIMSAAMMIKGLYLKTKNYDNLSIKIFEAATGKNLSGVKIEPTNDGFKLTAENVSESNCRKLFKSFNMVVGNPVSKATEVVFYKIKIVGNNEDKLYGCEGLNLIELYSLK